MSFSNDFSVGLRQIRKSPGSAILPIVAYGLGLGVVGFMLTIIFGWLRAHPETVAFDDLEFLRWDPSTEHLWKSGAQNNFIRYPDFREIHSEQEAFESLVAVRGATHNIVIDGYPERFQGAYATADFFKALSVQPQVGQLFVTGDDLPGSAKKAVISDQLWRGEFQASESVLGRVLTINGAPTEVIGVAPPGFDFPGQNRLWVNETLDPLEMERGGGEVYTIFGQLAPNRFQSSAQMELNEIAKRMSERYPKSNTGYISVDFRTITGAFMGDEFSRLFYVMFACSILVLIIACTNVANLTLSRATTRLKELSIRAALGGKRSRLINQMLVEGFAIALLGGLLGLAITYLSSASVWAWLVRNAEITGIPNWMNLDVDLRVVAALSAFTLLASVLASIVPAVKASRADVNEILKDNSRGASGLNIGVFSKLLVFFQLFLSSGLLIATSAMVTTANNATEFHPPYDPAGMMTARFDLPEGYGESDSQAALLNRLQQRLGASPSLEGVGFTSSYDMLNNWNSRWDVKGRERATDDDYLWGRHEIVSDNYFELLDIPILYGRGFEAVDSGENAEQICVANELFAQRVWPGESPLGKQIRDVWSEGNPWLTVVGVVPDTQMAGPGNRTADDRGGVYRPMSIAPQGSVTVFAKTSGDPIKQAEAIRAVFKDIMPDVALYRVKTVDMAIEDYNFGNLFFRNVFAFFGAAALILASIGVYGVMHFSVRRRFREFGIRQALGATGFDITRQVFGMGAVQVSVGVALGALLGYGIVLAISQAMGAISLHFLNYAVPIAIILCISAIALFSPAREVLRSNVSTNLRDE